NGIGESRVQWVRRNRRMVRNRIRTGVRNQHRRRPMQPSVTRFDGRNKAVIEGIARQRYRVEVAVGPKRKPWVTRTEERPARTGRERYGDLLPRAATIEGDRRDDVLKQSLNPDGDNVLRVDRADHDHWFGRNVQ